MALSGLHVACALSAGGTPAVQAYPLLGQLQWSQTMASGGTTDNSAPSVTSPNGVNYYLIFRVSVSADSYVAYGKSPNATSGPRTLVYAGQPWDFAVSPGDKLNWVAA